MKLIHSLWLSGAFLLVGAAPSHDGTGATEAQLALPCFKLSSADTFAAAEKEVNKTVELPPYVRQERVVCVMPSTRSDPIDRTAGSVQGVILRFAQKDPTMQHGLLLKCTVTRNGDLPVVVKYFESTGALDARAPDGSVKDGCYLDFSHDLTNLAYVDVEAVTTNVSGQGRIKYTGRASWVITGRRPGQ